jgi:TonB family protein
MNHQARMSTHGWLAVLGSLALSTLGLGQDLTSGGPDSIIAGPFGEPRMVMSEGGEWSYPIKVYANSDVETFVPDITSPGWISWHVAEFRQKGTYFTYLYIYHRDSRKTGRETIYVNTRENTAFVVRPLLAPVRIDSSKAPLELSKSIAKITTIVKEDTINFHGTTVQEDVLRERRAAARMALCSGPGTPNPDCNLSDSELEKKYPMYARPPSRLIPGAIPGVNCGVGTDRSCCCEDDATASNNPASSPTAQPNSPAMTDGVYPIGNGVSAPVLLSSVGAVFTDQARRAKYQGVCTLSVIIDSQGNPQNPQVVHGLEMGLNEKAIEAVMQYRFKPAMKDGKTPVPVRISVSVNFKLY